MQNTPPPEAPDKDWSKVLEWAERQGTDSMKSRMATAEILAKEAQSTLTVLLAGVGGSAAYAAKFFDPGPSTATTWGFSAACAYLSILCIVLIWKCMRFISYPALHQTPTNVMLKGFGLDALREVELKNLADRIDEAADINEKRAKALNAVRIAAVLSPAVFLFAALLPMLLRLAATHLCF